MLRSLVLDTCPGRIGLLLVVLPKKPAPVSFVLSMRRMLAHQFPLYNLIVHETTFVVFFGILRRTQEGEWKKGETNKRLHLDAGDGERSGAPLLPRAGTAFLIAQLPLPTSDRVSFAIDIMQRS
jgi:hypothetical protein